MVRVPPERANSRSSIADEGLNEENRIAYKAGLKQCRLKKGKKRESDTVISGFASILFACNSLAKCGDQKFIYELLF